MQAGQMVHRARPVLERHRHRAVGVELLDVASQGQPRLGREPAEAGEVLVGERDRLHVDVQGASRSCPR